MRDGAVLDKLAGGVQALNRFGLGVSTQGYQSCHVRVARATPAIYGASTRLAVELRAICIALREPTIAVARLKC